MGLKPQLTSEELTLALETVGQKWGKQGAKFLKDVQYSRSSITGLFTFDGTVYEVVIQVDTTLILYELDNEYGRKAVGIPPSLAFPKGFKRPDRDSN